MLISAIMIISTAAQTN